MSCAKLPCSPCLGRGDEVGWLLLYFCEVFSWKLKLAFSELCCQRLPGLCREAGLGQRCQFEDNHRVCSVQKSTVCFFCLFTSPALLPEMPFPAPSEPLHVHLSKFCLQIVSWMFRRQCDLPGWVFSESVYKVNYAVWKLMRLCVFWCCPAGKLTGHSSLRLVWLLTAWEPFNLSDSPEGHTKSSGGKQVNYTEGSPGKALFSCMQRKGRPISSWFKKRSKLLKDGV